MLSWFPEGFLGVGSSCCVICHLSISFLLWDKMSESIYWGWPAVLQVWHKWRQGLFSPCLLGYLNNLATSWCQKLARNYSLFPPKILFLKLYLLVFCCRLWCVSGLARQFSLILITWLTEAKYSVHWKPAMVWLFTLKDVDISRKTQVQHLHLSTLNHRPH